MQVHVHNKIPVCHNGIFPTRPWSRITHIVVHRIGRELGTTCEELAAAFKDTSTPQSPGSFTAGQFPYSFFIDPDGEVHQTLYIEDVSWHARRWSYPGLGVAVSGDFRVEPLSPKQYTALVSLCSLLAYFLRVYNLVGHTELKNASRDPEKECPGKFLDMDALRTEVAEKVRGVMELDDLGRKLVLNNYGIVV